MTSSVVYVVLAAIAVTSRVVPGAAARCPEACRCGEVSGAPSADCSSREIADLAPLVHSLDPDTTVLDLRYNQLTVIATDAFARLPNVSVLLLDDNQIASVEKNAFRGVRAVRLLSLTGNRLTTVIGNSFSQLAGQESACGGAGTSGRQSPTEDLSDGECVIDLTRNDIATVERHAFAWISHLDVHLGHGRRAMTVDAYAFYGAHSMHRVVVQDVPALTLRPRIFTNTESVAEVVVRSTKVDRLRPFVFEGLKGVSTILLDRVDVGVVEPYAFSGIHFRHPAPPPPTDAGANASAVNEVDAVRSRRRARYALSGGTINFTACHVVELGTDAFRDANLAHIVLSRTAVERLAPYAFRGVSNLQSLRLVDSGVGPTLHEHQFASLRGLRRLHLAVDAHTVERFAFRETRDVDELRVTFRADNVTLRTEAFAHVSDVGVLELRGRGPTDAAGSRPALTVDVGAFRNLVAVRHIRVVGFRLPTLRRHSFSGLSRVGNLTIADCGVADVEREAFGDVAGHVGAIGLLDLSAGNELRCECGTTTGVALRRELDLRFTDYRAVCRLDGGTSGSAVSIDVQQITGDKTSTRCGTPSSAARTFYSTSRLLSAVVASSVLLLAVYR